MTNVYKDLLTLHAKNKSTDMNTGLVTQGSLAKIRYDVSNNTPTARDADMEMAQSLRQQLGQGPHRGWRAAVAGVLNGLEYAGKTHAHAEKIDNARKMMEVFSSLEGIANEANRRNQHYAKQAALQEQLTPELEALTKNISRLPYDDLLKTGTELVEHINQSSGTHYQISMIDQHNGKVLLTEPGKPDQKVDLFAMFPKIREEQNVEYLTKKALETQSTQERRAEQQLSINQQNADAIHNRNQFHQDPNAQHDVMLGKEQAKAIAHYHAKLLEQNCELEDVAYTIQDLKELLKSSEVITGSTLEAGFERLIGKQLGTKAYADTELYDAISKGLLSFVKGNVVFGNMNQKEFEFLATQTPDSHKTKAALERMLNRFETTLDRQMKRNEREMHQVPRYGTRSQIAHEEQQAQMSVQPHQILPEQMQATQSIQLTQPNQPDQSSPAPQTEMVRKMVRMIAPDGTKVLIPAINVDIAMSQGARLVE